MILCCGEALIDMIPYQLEDNQKTYIPKVGGSIYNTAIALGRMGANPFFLGAIAGDEFGEMILDELKQSKVNTSLCLQSDFNTTFAFANIKNGTTTYTFIDENSANKNINLKDISALPKEITTLYIGGICLMSEPNGSEIETFINKESKDKVVFFDPNIRPNLIKNKSVYMKRFENILLQSDIIKVSDEDLEWLYPDSNEDEICNMWLEKGLSIVVLTKGSAGALIKSNNHEVFSKGKKVEVVDTIGAGDIFNAAFVFSLSENNCLEKKTIKDVSAKILVDSLDFANKVACISVTRVGSNSPTLKEIDNYKF